MKLTVHLVRRARYIALPGETGFYSRLRVPDGHLELAFPARVGPGTVWWVGPATKQAPKHRE